MIPSSRRSPPAVRCSSARHRATVEWAFHASRHSASGRPTPPAVCPYAPSASGSFAATSQMWPSGSVKLAVRIPTLGSSGR
jgi:hypothetical protein